jgi:predicted  nucleic acid-binding Zn-ribbon protein
MTMESVLKQLEGRLDELVTAYRAAVGRVAELEAKLAEAEKRATRASAVNEQVEAFEREKQDLGTRLQKVLEIIDTALDRAT